MSLDPHTTAQDAEHIRRNPVLIQAGSAALARLASDSGNNLVLAVLLTDDGFEVVRTPQPSVEGSGTDGRYASMASSVQALSEAVLHELKMGAGDVVIIQGAEGVVIQTRIPGHTIVISAQFRARESLGKSLAARRVAVQQLQADLAQSGTALAS